MTFFKGVYAWKAEELDLLHKLVESGLTRVEIASAMGRKISAISSKIIGLGLNSKVKPDRRASKEVKIKFNEPDIFTQETPTMTTLFLVQNNQCRWPILRGNDKQWCCGDRLMRHETYCDYHANFAHVGPKSA